MAASDVENLSHNYLLQHRKLLVLFQNNHNIPEEILEFCLT